MASDPPPPQTAKKPVRLGKYEVIQHIANGGMGAIYRAVDTETGREVALKILRPDDALKPAMVVRFRREYASASKMRHENIVQLYELGELNQTLYFAMEFVDGVDLYEHVRKNGTLDPEVARQIILQGARALRHAHQHAVVHRDIKPSNFLLARRPGKPFIKLTDFGLARDVSDDQFRVTRAGTTVGTIDYMSPEQARDSGAADIRSDLYSLGSTWFHLLTGQCPFPDGGLGQRLIQIMNDPPPDARVLNPKVSDETWAVLERLLSKDAEDRHQTPEELIDDLLHLEGKAVAPPKPRPSPRKKPRSRPVVAGDQAEAEAGYQPEASFWGGLGPLLLGAGTILLVVSILFVVFQPRRRPPVDDKVGEAPPVVVPVVVPRPDQDKPGARTLVTPKVEVPPKKPTSGLPVLYRFAGDPASLRAEAEKPWAGAGAPAGPALRVRRVVTEPGWFATLADAAAAAPADRPLVIEVHDNGPLYELPLATVGRPVTVRAAPGYRPLIVWDVPATLEKRRVDRKLDQPPVFLSVAGGGLRLEGLEFGWRCPETLTEPLTFASVNQGDVRLIGCTFSGSGRPRQPGTLLRVRSDRPGTRVRLDRCHVRALSFGVVDCRAPQAEAMMDGCLISSTDAALVRLTGRDRVASNLRIIGSTLVGSRRLIELTGYEESDVQPRLSVLAWDALLARSGSGPGELLGLAGRAGPGSVEWKPVNVLYAGWGRLLTSGETAVTDLAGWRKQWSRTDGDGVAPDGWPDGGEEPGVRPAATYRPAGRMLFASTADPARPLGCDLTALPPCRDGWLGQAVEGPIYPPEPINAPDAPEIPAPGDDRFHGARLDLTDGTDLGEYLASVQTARKLGERVVLHLSGKGEVATSPVRVRGATLVLHFEEPADKDTPRLALKGAVGPDGAIIDVEGGGLDVIGGVIRAPDTPKSAYAHVLRTRGGAMRLFRTRVEGPTLSYPDGYVGAVSFSGSGKADPEKALPCSLNECVVLSCQKGLTVEGLGAKTLVRNSLLVAAEALAMLPGRDCADDGGQQVTVEGSTLAFRRAAFLLGPASDAPIATPIALRTRDCALLCPFVGMTIRPGLVSYEGESLPCGLLAWRSERDALDARLHYFAWPAGTPLPEAKAARAVWQQILGSYGVRAPRPELLGLRVLDGKGWVLDRLSLPGREPPGANFARLGIGKKG